MIVVVALNPALDVTHHVQRVDWAGVNRAADVQAVPGGKGLNVARTLHRLGASVLLVGFAGGSAGGTLRAALVQWGVPDALTEIAGETRRTFTVVDTGRGDVALFNEPGPAVTAAEFARFRDCFGDVVSAGTATAVVLSGSLPTGLPTDAYADLTQLASAASVPTVLDTSGEALLHGAAASPAIVKPNLAELSAAVGRRLRWDGWPDRRPVVEAATELQARGPAAVIVSLGEAGLLAVTGDGSWLAAPQPVQGNPTGAGDATVAGLTHALVHGRPWPERLRHAAALGSAAAAAPVAGEFCPVDYDRAHATVQVRSLRHGLRRT